MEHHSRSLRAFGPDRLLARAVPQPSAGLGAHEKVPLRLCVLPVALLPFRDARRYPCGDPAPGISLIDRAISTDRSSETIEMGAIGQMGTTTGTEQTWVAGWGEWRRGTRCR
jgi:hypothetical protein